MSSKQYKLGDNCVTGQEISTILGQSSNAVVYTTLDNHLRWEYFANSGVVPNWLLPAVTVFDSLMSKIKITLPENHKRDAYNELGKNLFTALNITNEEKFYDTFTTVRKDIYLKGTEPLRIRYILSAVACAAIMIAICVPLGVLLYDIHKDAKAFFILPLFGSLGAILSVMQRSPSLELDPLSSKLYTCIQGSIRAILGVLCGLFLLILIKANLFLGIFSDNNYVIAVFATVAGVSERFVPDLIKKFEAMQLELNVNASR